MKKMLAMLLVCGSTVVMASAFEQKPEIGANDVTATEHVSGSVVNDTVPTRRDTIRRNSMPTDTFSRPVRDTMTRRDSAY